MRLITTSMYLVIAWFLDATDKEVFTSVVENLRLADGTLFPIPVTLDLSKEDIERLEVKPGARLALRDPRDEEILAVITGKY